MASITINISDEEKKILTTRAKKNFQSIKELIEEIIRKSAIRTKKSQNKKPIKVDDRLVGIFSRQRSGRPRKKK